MTESACARQSCIQRRDDKRISGGVRNAVPGRVWNNRAATRQRGSLDVAANYDEMPKAHLTGKSATSVEVMNLGLLLLLFVRWWRCVFLVVADDPLDGADVEYGALDAAHCQRNRAKCHDQSPEKTQPACAPRAVVWYALRIQLGGTFNGASGSPVSQLAA